MKVVSPSVLRRMLVLPSWTVTTVALSCTDHDLTAPRNSEPRRTTLMSNAVDPAAYPPPSTLGGSAGPPGSVRVLGFYERPVVAEIRITGNTARTWIDSENTYAPDSKTIGINGLMVSGACRLNAWVQSAGGGTSAPYCPPWSDTYVPQSEDTQYRLLQGQVELHIAGGYAPDPNRCCVTYGVSVQTTVTPLEGQLLVKSDSQGGGSSGPIADGAVLPWGRTVYLEAYTNVSHGQTMPLVMLNWHFIPAGRVTDSLTINSTSNCSLSNNYGTSRSLCGVQVRQSGTFVIEALSNGLLLRKTLSVVVSKGVTLTAAPTNSFDGEIVQFTATAQAGATIQSIEKWTWQPDSAPGRTVIGALCATPTTTQTCLAQVMEAGWMHVTAKVNGHTEQDSARVTAEVPCPTTDTLVNRRVMRELLQDLWNNSSANGPSGSRRERGGIVYQSGGELRSDWNISPMDSACSNPGGRRAAPSGGTRLAGVHVHPFSPYTSGFTTDTLPWVGCGGKPPMGPKASKPGPSQADWNASYADGVPHCIADRDSIYIITPPTGKKTITEVQPDGSLDTIEIADPATGTAKSFPRKSTCTIFGV